KNEFPILVLDENYMKKLEETHSDVESKISDMEFTLRKYVLVDETRTPIQESIAEKVERILRLWKEHKLSNLQAYKNLKKLVGAFNKIKKRQEELGLSDAEYYTFLILENRLKTTTDKLISDTKELITEIKPKMFKGWSLQKSVVKDIERIVRRKIRKYGLTKGERDELHEKLMENLKRLDK
ncbi:MAG: DUF3387 domain-containing protein, partial [Candidatus Diapherotrites archaeon]|nr:DUF3387 domain-containing protein [Candidatus Diapherotrites archaeon]